MFELGRYGATQAGPKAEGASPRISRSLGLSLAFHMLAVLAALTVHVTTELAVLPGQSGRVLLVAPATAPVRAILRPLAAPRRPAAPPRRPEVNPEIRVEARPNPRPFLVPVPVAATPVQAVLMPDAPSLDVPKPALPAAEMPRMSLPRPQPKLDNLTGVRIESPPAAPPARTQTGAFSGSQAEQSPVSRPAASTGGFGDSSTGTPADRRPAAAAKSGFGDTTVATPQTPTAASSAAASASPVEIISKPRPAYTEEARRLQIQGEVLLEVLFSAAAELRVIRMVRGLGHGLDESAVAAAQQIRFRPARRQGTPVDSTAIVHIVFELAQ